ncbi:MAG: hypothetical protein AB7O24_00950 [Kofleriaceae bacterium]
MLRLIGFLALVLGLGYCGATVKLGDHTFFGHVQRIWATDEAQDLKKGVEETAGPTLDKVKRGVRAGMEAVGSGSGSGSGSGGDAGSGLDAGSGSGSDAGAGSSSDGSSGAKPGSKPRTRR